jgi:predicted dehydrogenase
LLDLVPDLDVLSLSAERLGPPIEREIDDTVVMDLMIHDVDILLSLVAADVDSLQATGTEDGRYATGTVGFTDGTVARLTASRITQRKTRRLTITARECVVEVDYIDQSVEIHRNSVPEYVQQNGDIRYRHESVVERPVVQQGEPLKNELRSFLRCVTSRERPMVSAEDGIRALEMTARIDDLAFGDGPSSRTREVEV